MRTRACARFTVVLICGWLAQAQETRIELKQGWSIQSSAKGDLYPTTVPSTVLATLVKNKVYPDPYFGMNLRAIPGTTYGIGMNFANMAMPADSPFRPAWWYRTEFQIPKSVKLARLSG